MNKTITLTIDEINTLACYILMTTNYRKKEAAAWDELAKEKKDDGTPKFEHAADNAKYWLELEDKLTEIREKMEG